MARQEELKKEKQKQEKLLEEQRKKELEKQRLEKERLEKEKREKERLEKERLEKERQEKLKREKLEREKKLAAEKAAAKKAAEERAAAQKAAEEKAKAEKLEKIAEQARTEQMQRLAGMMAGASGDANAKGTAAKSSGPSASYAGRIRARVKPNIVYVDEIAGNPAAEVTVLTSPDGTIIGRSLARSSGVASWDEAVLKAIDKTQVLPRDVDGTVPSSLTLIFRPKD